MDVSEGPEPIKLVRAHLLGGGCVGLEPLGLDTRKPRGDLLREPRDDLHLLARASHVFHFDRWWNPAVENQATDRAFRIGRRRRVQVHKFLCAGTLEEKIDEMIERKKQVAEAVVGTREGWLTELSTAELKELIALRPEAVSEE